MASPDNRDTNLKELQLARAVVQEVKKALLISYEEAGISGLCDEGRFEAALGALETLPLEEIVAKAALRKDFVQIPCANKVSTEKIVL